MKIAAVIIFWAFVVVALTGCADEEMDTAPPHLTCAQKDVKLFQVRTWKEAGVTRAEMRPLADWWINVRLGLDKLQDDLGKIQNADACSDSGDLDQ